MSNCRLHCASIRWFAVCCRCGCVITWGHELLPRTHHPSLSHHLLDQPWQHDWCPSEAVGHRGRAHRYILGLHPASAVVAALNRRPRRLLASAETICSTCLTVIRMLIKVQMGKAGKSAALRTDAFIILQDTTLPHNIHNYRLLLKRSAINI